MIHSMASKKRKLGTEQAEINKQIGARLRKVRNWKTMSQAEVARELKMSRGRWSMYESGQRALSVYVMIEFAKLMQCDLHLILSPDEDPSGAMRKRQKEDAESSRGG